MAGQTERRPGFRADLAKRHFDSSDGVIPEYMVNAYPRLLSPGGESGAVFKITHVPGLEETHSSATNLGLCRGLWWDRGSPETRIVGVFTSTLYEFASNAQVTASATYPTTGGSAIPDNAMVHFVASDAHIMMHLSFQTSAYLYDGSTLTVISDGDFPSPCADIGWAGGRFLALDQANRRVYYSDLDDGTSWTSTGYFEVEDYPQALCVYEEIVYVFCDSTIEQHGVTTDADSPYQRRVGATVEKGIPHDGVQLVVATSMGLYFMGNDFAIWRLNRTALDKVSPPWLDALISALFDANNIDPRRCEMETFIHRGVTWVTLTGPTLGTWWLNTTLGEWISRETTGETQAVPKGFVKNRHRGGVGVGHSDGGADQSRRILCGSRDATSTGLYALSDTVFTDPLDGAEVVITRQFSASVPLDRGGVPIDVVSLTGTPGRVTTSAEPVIVMEPSLDGGRTWGSPLSRSIGTSTDYDEPILWAGLGMAAPPGLVLRFTTSAEAAFDVTAVRVNEDPAF